MICLPPLPSLVYHAHHNENFTPFVGGDFLLDAAGLRQRQQQSNSSETYQSPRSTDDHPLFEQPGNALIRRPCNPTFAAYTVLP